MSTGTTTTTTTLLTSTAIPRPPEIEEIHNNYAKLPISFQFDPDTILPLEQHVNVDHLKEWLEPHRFMIGVEIQFPTMVQFLERHKSAMAKEKIPTATEYTTSHLLPPSVCGMKIQFHQLPKEIMASLVEKKNLGFTQPSSQSFFVATVECNKPLPYQDLLQYYAQKKGTITYAEMFQSGSPYEQYIAVSYQRIIEGAFDILTFLKLDFARDFTPQSKGVARPLFHKIQGLPDLGRDHHNQYIGVIHRSNSPFPLLGSELYGINPDVQFTHIGKEDKLCMCKMTSHLYILPFKCDKKHLPEYANRIKYKRI